MAGTIFGLPLSQQFGSNQEFLSGGLLYIYAAGTSTPSDAFEDYGLTAGLELPHPIELDSTGRIPEFWLADGSYRVRLTDADGVVVFDINSTTALGPSSGSSGSSSGVSETSIFQTGDPIWVPKSGTRSGWVRLNGRTIGSSSSGATERANADTQSLYEYLWANHSDSDCPVTGGRGGSAAADFAANKPIATYTMRNKGAIGLDGMGNTALGELSDTASAIGGAITKTLATTEIPSHTHGDGSYQLVSNAINNGTSVARGSISTDDDTAENGNNQNVITGASISTSTLTISNADISGTSGATGGGTAFSLMNPYRQGTWYIKL